MGELSCMLCGEAVATLEGGTLLRPRMPEHSHERNSNRVWPVWRKSFATDQGERVHFV